MSDDSACATLREGTLYVGESRVELYSVVASWQQGYSQESEAARPEFYAALRERLATFHETPQDDTSAAS